MGFFSAFENDGPFDNSSGLAGFYGNYQNSISGSIPPLFYDMELNNDQGIELQLSVNVRNNTNFVFGDIITSKTNSTSYLEFGSTSFYNGESNFSKVNGFVAISNVQNFLFPIGDEQSVRPLGIDTESNTASFKSAYVFGDATMANSNNIASNAELSTISSTEYWLLQGAFPTMITIGWDERSEIENMTNDERRLTVVGFNKALGQWENLGAAERSGNVTEGFISSAFVVPDNYSAITFGSLITKTAVSHKGYHYMVSPNGDGINDFLYIPELENYETNTLQIFDRNGLKVFEQDNYTSEFNGVAGVNVPAISRNRGLPEGVYFYLVSAGKQEFTIQGFLYLKRND